MRRDDSRLVYSTDSNQPDRRKSTPPKAAGNSATGPQTAKIMRVKRRGKWVTLVQELALPPAALKELAKQIKETCACGGSVKDGEIEIQGDQREKVAEVLRARGCRFKYAGG